MFSQLKLLTILITLSGSLLSCSKPLDPKKEVDQYINSVKTKTSLILKNKQTSRIQQFSKKTSTQKFNCKKQKCVLNSFPLNSLSLVGVLSNMTMPLAFISSSSGTIITIKRGDVISSDYLKVIQISQSGITLRNSQSRNSILPLFFNEF